MGARKSKILNRISGFKIRVCLFHIDVYFTPGSILHLEVSSSSIASFTSMCMLPLGRSYSWRSLRRLWHLSHRCVCCPWVDPTPGGLFVIHCGIYRPVLSLLVFTLHYSYFFSLSWLYHRVFHKSNTTGTTSEAGNTYPSRAPDFIPEMWWGLCCSICSCFCVVFWWQLLFFLFFPFVLPSIFAFWLPFLYLQTFFTQKQNYSLRSTEKSSFSWLFSTGFDILEGLQFSNVLYLQLDCQLKKKTNTELLISFYIIDSPQLITLWGQAEPDQLWVTDDTGAIKKYSRTLLSRFYGYIEVNIWSVSSMF